jgi:Tol biopolymer transport system component
VALALGIAGALVAPSAALATFPGGNGLIAFSRNGDIYTIDPQSKHEVRLTKDEHVDTSPDWSPDGTRLVFQRDNDVTGEPHVYVMNADGSGVTWITQGDSPDWSRDGTRIVFGRTTGDDGDDTIQPLFTIRPDKTGEKELKTRYQDAQEPDWSPTSDWVVYQRDGDDQQDYLDVVSPSDSYINWNLPTVSLPHASPGWGVDSEDGSWHPSGDELLLWMGPSQADLCNPGTPFSAGDCEADHRWGLYRMRIDGSGATLVKKGAVEKSAFSPDGKQIVYSIPVYPAPGMLGLIREDGTDVRLTDGQDPDWQAVAVPPPPPPEPRTTTVTTTVTQTVTVPGPTRTVTGPTRTVTATRTGPTAPGPQDRCVIPPGKRYTLTLRATKAIRKGARFQVRVGKQGQISILKPGRAGVTIAAVR